MIFLVIFLHNVGLYIAQNMVESPVLHYGAHFAKAK